MNLKTNKLKILILYKKFLYNIENILINVPKKDYISRSNFYNKSLELLELIYYTNLINNKLDNQLLILSKLSVLDYYIERLYKNRYISESYSIKLSKELNEITKLIYGWIKQTN